MKTRCFFRDTFLLMYLNLPTGNSGMWGKEQKIEEGEEPRPVRRGIACQITTFFLLSQCISLYSFLHAVINPTRIMTIPDYLWCIKKKQIREEKTTVVYIFRVARCWDKFGHLIEGVGNWYNKASTNSVVSLTKSTKHMCQFKVSIQLHFDTFL